MKANLRKAPRRERDWRALELVDCDDEFSPLSVAARETPPPPAGNPAADFAAADDPDLCFGILGHPLPTAGEIEVSAFFRNARKKEIYDAWVDFDLLPGFMRGPWEESAPERFEVPWFLKLRDADVRWEGTTTECVPTDRITWRSADRAAPRNSGCVTFVAASRTSTRVIVSIQFEGISAPQVTERTLKCIESQIHDTFDFLHTFLGPHALPPSLACT